MTRPTRTEIDALRCVNEQRTLGRAALSLADTYEDDGALASAAKAASQAAEHFTAAHNAGEAAERARHRQAMKERFGK